MAEEAERFLKENGAAVKFNTYDGGHGWRGNVYGRIRDGIQWLEGAVIDLVAQRPAGTFLSECGRAGQQLR